MIHFIFSWNISQLDQGSGNWLKEWKKNHLSFNNTLLSIGFYWFLNNFKALFCFSFTSCHRWTGKWKWLELMESGSYCLMASNWRAGNLEITIKMLDQRAIWHSVVLLRTSSFAFILTIGRPNHCKKDEHGIHHDLVEPTRKELAE